jgi:hypothetical protein
MSRSAQRWAHSVSHIQPRVHTSRHSLIMHDKQYSPTITGCYRVTQFTHHPNNKHTTKSARATLISRSVGACVRGGLAEALS